jgi:hypothetical protein
MSGHVVRAIDVPLERVTADVVDLLPSEVYSLQTGDVPTDCATAHSQTFGNAALAATSETNLPEQLDDLGETPIRL